MKKLYEVTLEDAKEILSAGYKNFFLTGNWKLTNETKVMEEPCVKLKCATKLYLFWFMNDSIDMQLADDNMMVSFVDVNFDVKYLCYIKAVQLGYYVPELSELLVRTDSVGEVQAKQSEEKHYCIVKSDAYYYKETNSSVYWGFEESKRAVFSFEEATKISDAYNKKWSDSPCRVVKNFTPTQQQ